MLTQILLHTPTWVFGLFALLLALGVSQLSTRRASLARVSIVPLAMLGLSFSGVRSGFAAQPEVLIGWLAALGAGAAWLLSRPLPASTTYDPAARQFTLPGSALPLVLMMSIFCTKYAVGVAMAVSPSLAHHSGAAWAISLVYGALSGLFLGRAARLWKLAAKPALGAPIAASLA